METIKGKVTLVTGGGRGLGEAICRELASAGAKVIIVDVRKDLIEKLAKELQSQGAEAFAYEVDLMNEKQIQNLFETIQKEHGGLDFLINNAGIDKTVSVEELDIMDWDCIVAVNLRAPFITSKLAFPMMREKGGGHIVNICSTAAKRAWPNAAGYHATKWGLLGLTEALHTEGRPLGIKVTALIAGGMRTPFLFDRFPDLDPNLLQDPKNVAETVHYLLTQPKETVISEVMVIPMRETSWP
jgi:NAD(P)-dependent dehydrogenase (short-subunit alcohol dehydrogenase family)